MGVGVGAVVEAISQQRRRQRLEQVSTVPFSPSCSNGEESPRLLVVGFSHGCFPLRGPADTRPAQARNVDGRPRRRQADTPQDRWIHSEASWASVPFRVHSFAARVRVPQAQPVPRKAELPGRLRRNLVQHADQRLGTAEIRVNIDVLYNIIRRCATPPQTPPASSAGGRRRRCSRNEGSPEDRRRSFTASPGPPRWTTLCWRSC